MKPTSYIIVGLMALPIYAIAQNPSVPAPQPSATPTSASQNQYQIKAAACGSNQCLVDSQGKTLYIFDADTSGKSTCNGACAAVWPPLTAPEGQAYSSGSNEVNNNDLGTIKRDDGSQQVT